MKQAIIKTAVFWANGTTMAYDDQGNAMPQYEGALSDQGSRILADAPADTVFFLSSWSGSGVRCHREELESLVAQMAD